MTTFDKSMAPSSARTGHASRRDILKVGAGLAAAAAFPMPAIAQERTIKVGSYGGYFENSFIDNVYPAFKEATGITVESVTQPNSSAWLTTMEQATKAGAVPADISLYDKIAMIRASKIGMLKAYDLTKAPNTSNLEKLYLFDGGAGVVGVGAMSWYVNMIINTEQVTPAPASWAEFWEPKFAGKLGMYANYDGRLIDIAAKTFFDGPATLATDEGIIAVIDKIAELKPNVKIWWKAENVMQNAMQNEEVVAGQYYHDVTGIMASEGFPVASVFPKEGNVVDYGSWCLSSISTKEAEALEFVNFCSLPSTQALMSRKIGTAPLVAKSLTDLTDEEFLAVSSEQAPIVPAYEVYLEKADFIQSTWEKMLTA